MITRLTRASSERHRDHDVGAASDDSLHDLLTSRQLIYAVGALALAALLWLHRDTLASMVETWLGSETFGHGFLIVPIAAIFAYRLRVNLRTVEIRPSPWGLVMLAVAVLLFAAAWVSAVVVVRQLAVVSMVPILLWAVLGRQFVATLAFPLAYLFFAVPVGESLIPPLMEWTATFTVTALNLTGLPVYREGMLIHSSFGTFEVAEACSGIRYLIASVALGSVYAYFAYHSTWRRLAFMSLSVLFPVVANGIRAYGIVMIAHWSDMRLAVGIDHFIYGWVFFGLVIFLLFWVGHSFRDRDRVLPWNRATDSRAGVQERSDKPSAVFLMALGGIALVWGGKALATTLASQALTLPDSSLPAGLSSWRGPAAPSGDWRPSFPGALAEHMAQYSDGERVVDVYVALYGNPRQAESEVVYSGNNLSPNWRVTEAEERQVVSTGGKAITVNTMQLRRPTARRTVWFWYQVGARHVTTELQVKSLQAWGGIIGHIQPSAVIAVSSSATSSFEVHERDLDEFLFVHYSTLVDCIVERARSQCEIGP